jgi:hypothetical protein
MFTTHQKRKKIVCKKKLLCSTHTKKKLKKSYANKYIMFNTDQKRKKIRMQIKLLCSTHTKKEKKAYALKGWWHQNLCVE